MARSREITDLAAMIVTLSAIGVVVAQDATAQETPLPNAQTYINRSLAYSNKDDNDRAIADFTQAIQLGTKDARALINRGIATTRTTISSSAIRLIR
jgi:Tfp pilus assembly protein PilF